MPHQAKPPLVITIADDLTGALDSGVEFAKCGLSTYVATSAQYLDAALDASPDCLVVNMASREISAAEALKRHSDLRRALAGLDKSLVFKKVDSRLKGNISAEINGLIGSQSKPIILAPAIPDMGRVHQAGQLSGTGIDKVIDVAERCRPLACPIHVPDILQQQDFARVIEAAPGDALFVGAKGIAQALAASLSHQHGVESEMEPPLKSIKGSLFAAIGSRDPITLRQIDSLSACKLADFRHMSAPDGCLSEAIMDKGGSLLLQLTDGGSGQSSDIVGARFTAAAAEIFKQNQHDNLFACGGQTAQDLIDILSIPVLKLTGELFPGVPVSEALFDSRPFWLITKSGGFGDPDLLANLFKRRLDTSKA